MIFYQIFLLGTKVGIPMLFWSEILYLDKFMFYGTPFLAFSKLQPFNFWGGEGGGGGGIYRWKGIFFWDRYVQDFSSYPITMYDIYFASLLFRSIFFQ